MFAIKIKKAKESVLKKRHPWIFSGAVETISSKITPGSICQVLTPSGSVFGYGMVNPKTDLVCRMLSFNPKFSHETFVEDRLKAAWSERQEILHPENDSAFRLINADGDGMPGLIVDIFADIAVIQISTMGMELVKPRIVAFLADTQKLKGVYEKSNSPARVQDGLHPKANGWLNTSDTQEPQEQDLTITEHGLRYTVPVVTGQKTGFFIDQRDMRLLLRQYAKNKSVLNCFAYTGGFSLNALVGGASRVVSVDSSQSACDANRANHKLNHLPESEIICQDALQYLATEKEFFDVIILDPPPYVKKAKDQQRGFGHYLELNRLGLQRLKKGGILLTFSCSPFFTDEQFYKMISFAATSVSKDMRFLTHHRHASDHPVGVTHPEGRYLKGCVIKEISHD